MLIRGALANALAFTGSSYLFPRLPKDSIDKERKGYNLVIEKLQKAQIEWPQKRQQRINVINKHLMLERRVDTKFMELNDTMREYHEVFGHDLEPLPPRPLLSGFYTPSEEQHDRELAFIVLSMVGIGGVLWWLEKS